MKARTTYIRTTADDLLLVTGENARGVETEAGTIAWADVAAWLTRRDGRWFSVPTNN